MKPFDCDMCGLKTPGHTALVRWHYDKSSGSTETFQVVHDSLPCNSKGPEGYFNRSLPLDYVFKNMPEFLSYISGHSHKKKELKNFTQRIEKDRSYIRRFNVDRKEVKKLIIRLDGLGE